MLAVLVGGDNDDACLHVIAIGERTNANIPVKCGVALVVGRIAVAGVGKGGGVIGDLQLDIHIWFARLNIHLHARFIIYHIGDIDDLDI